MYSLTIKAPDILRELIFKITDNALPAMVEIGTKEGENKSKIVHQKLLLVTVCLSGIAFWLMYILNQWFLFLWLGDQYFVGQSILFLALVIMVQHNILHVSGLSLYGIGMIKGSSLMQIVEAILNLGFTIWLGKVYGIKGILLATIIACWLSVMWYIPHITMVKLKIRFYEYLVKPILIPLFFISMAGYILYLLVNQLFATVPVTWISFILVSGAIAFLLGGIVWIVFLRNELAEYVPVRFRKYLLIS
jgi:O-antigen/teichoic acid export membrane protein